MTFHTRYILSAAVLVALSLCGCGKTDQKSGRPEVDDAPAEDLHGAATKAMLYEFRAKVRKRGVGAVKTDLPQILESFESLEKRPVGEHLDTYKQIAEKLKGMEGSTSKEAAVKTANEIGVLADKLPGKAHPNPQVE